MTESLQDSARLRAAAISPFRAWRAVWPHPPATTLRAWALLIHRKELAAEFKLLAGHALAEGLDFHRAVLEAAFREDGHVHSRDGLHAARDDVAFQRVEL